MFTKTPEATSYVIGSAFKGQLQKDGKPLVNTTVIRRLRWNGNEDGIEQEFTTDENGVFDLPVHEEMLNIPALTEYVGKTDLFAVVDGERDQFWFLAKMDNAEHSEFDETPKGVVCELNSSIERIEVNHGLGGGKCTWENMPKEQ